MKKQNMLASMNIGVLGSLHHVKYQMLADIGMLHGSCPNRYQIKYPHNNNMSQRNKFHEPALDIEAQSRKRELLSLGLSSRMSVTSNKAKKKAVAKNGRATTCNLSASVNPLETFCDAEARSYKR